MRCELAERVISSAMDEPTPVPEDIGEHVRTCPRCSAFAAGAWRLREAARFEVAPEVPDLVPAIMAAVREEVGMGPATRGDADLSRRAAGRSRRGWRTAAIGLVAGFVVGAVVTAGLIPVTRTNTRALAAEIPAHLVSAARGLGSYRATFDITELHWTGDVPSRTFTADVAFRAPESFRVSVRDTTDYPSTAWPRNDLLLVSDGRSWRATGPDPCPRAALPACPQVSPVTRSVVDRAPFDAQTAMPTDVIVPMTVLAAANRVTVLGDDEVAGRAAVAVQLSYQDATPLFDYLRFLGSWRPFFPQDRVVIWLDRETWFPLRYEVFPAPGPGRSRWAAGLGFPAEPADVPVFVARARSLSTRLPPPHLFAVRPGPDPVDEGFRDLAGSPSFAPSSIAGLSLWRYGRFDPSLARPYEETVAAYAHGLAWLTVSRVRGWHQPRLYGVGPFAERVLLPGGGIVYYEPASQTQPRRVAAHGAEGEFVLASNLPRQALLAAAASLSLGGLAEPEAWRVRRWAGGVVEAGLPPDEAVARAGFEVLMPTELPDGYRPVSAELERTAGRTGVTIAFRRPAAELGGPGILLYQAARQPLPPATGADQEVLAVRATLGRWSPEQHVLEWEEDGAYRSLAAPGVDVATLLRLAASLRPVDGAGG